MIRYIPNLDSTLWARKSIEYFDSIDDLKAFISEQRTLFCHFVGRTGRFFHPHDVQLAKVPPDPFMRWNNYHGVIIDGITVGYCGE